MLITTIPSYSVALWGIEIIQNASVPATQIQMWLLGAGQVFWWLVTLAAGFCLVLPNLLGKWLLLSSLVMSSTGAVSFVSWVPGIGLLVQSGVSWLGAYLALMLLNGVIVVCSFVLSRKGNVRWHKQKPLAPGTVGVHLGG